MQMLARIQTQNNNNMQIEREYEFCSMTLIKVQSKAKVFSNEIGLIGNKVKR